MTTLDEMIKKYGIDLKTQYGGNLLHLFAQHNAAELLNELIDKGLDKNAKDEQGHTPLHIAAISNSVEAINALIDKGADKEALDEYKRSPLYLASSEYYKPHSLTNKEIDIEFKGVSGYTPLALSRYTPTAAIKALLDKGADGSHAIYYVVDNGKYSVITIFIKAGIIPSNSAKNYIQHEEYFGIKNLMLIINEAFRQNDYKSLVNIYKNNHYSTTLLSSDVGKLFYNNYYNVAAFNSDKTIKLNKEIERGIESVKANILNDFIKSIFDDAEIKLINAFFVKKLPIQRVFQNQELFNIISRFLPLSQQYDLTNPHNQEPLNKEFSESKKASFYKTLSLTSIQTNQKSALEAIFEEKNVQKLNVDLKQVKKAIIKDVMDTILDLGKQNYKIQAFYLDEGKDALIELLYMQFSVKYLKINIIYKSTKYAKYGNFIFSPENNESSSLTVKIYKNNQGYRLIKTEIGQKIITETHSELGKRSLLEAQLESNEAKKAKTMDQALQLSGDEANSELDELNSSGNLLRSNLIGSFPMQIPTSLQTPLNQLTGSNFIQNDQKLSILMPCINFLGTKEKAHDSSSSQDFSSGSPINKIAIGAFAVKETLESLPVVTSFLNIYDIDTSWIRGSGIDVYAHFLASYAGSLILLGEIDPAKAIFSNTLYQAKQEIREDLYKNYQQAEDKSIDNPIEFIDKCGSYIMDQTLVSFANSNLDFLAMASSAQNGAIAGIECYNLYNSQPLTNNDDSNLSQVAKLLVYPTMILSSFDSMDFSTNFNAMESYKQGISTLSSIVMADQLVGVLSHIIED